MKRPSARLAIVSAGVLAIVGLTAARLAAAPGPPVPWAHLGTEDVHSLAFVPGSTERLLFGHHGGILESADGGRTWAPLPADLPNLDIHAFARDPTEPARMWAYLAEGGIYESTDGGRHWTKVNDGHRPFLAAVAVGDRVELLGIDPFEGFARSADGGRTWRTVSRPEAYPVFSLAASPDGRVVVLGTSDGLLRSDDGGST